MLFHLAHRRAILLATVLCCCWVSTVNAGPEGEEKDVGQQTYSDYTKDVADVNASYTLQATVHTQVEAAYTHATQNRVRCSKRFFGSDFDGAFKSIEGARSQLETQNAAILKALVTARKSLRKAENDRKMLEYRYRNKSRDEDYVQALLDISADGESGYVDPMNLQVIPAYRSYDEAFQAVADVYNGLGADCSRGVPNRVLRKRFDDLIDVMLDKSSAISKILKVLAPLDSGSDSIKKSSPVSTSEEPALSGASNSSGVSSQ